MIVLAAALQEANNFAFIIIAGITWIYTIVLVTEIAAMRSQWRQHAIPEISRLTRKGNPHTSQALGGPRDWSSRHTNDHSNTAVQLYWTKPKGYSRRTAEIERTTRSLMRWIPIGTALFASRLVVLHITNHNWLSLVLSKLCFASDITDGSYHFEIIMAMYKSIITISLATVLGSLITIVLLNHLPRHLGLIWSSFVLTIFVIFRKWANDLTLVLPQLVSRTKSFTCGRFSNSKHADLISQVLVAAINALILSTLERTSQKCISFGAKYPLLRIFLYFSLQSLLTNI
jgi:hypothetical protein